MGGDKEKDVEQGVWTPRVEQLLREWRNRVYAAQTAYYEEAERFRRWNYRLGIPVAIVSSLVGTAVFSDVDKASGGSSGWPRYVVGSLSIIAAILASLQTFLKFGENAALHGTAGDWFAAIRRDIEELLALPQDMRGRPKACLDSIRQEMNRAGQKSPELSERLWRRVAKRFHVEEPPPSARLAAREQEEARHGDLRDSGFRPKLRRSPYSSRRP